MKKHFSFILLLALMLSVFSLGYAATVTIGTGTGTTYQLPIYGNYGYNYSQQIYTQGDIDRAGDITKIRFWYSSGDISLSKDWVIYMGHTQKTSFTSTSDWVPFADLTEVFDGDVSAMVPSGAGWMEITLQNPFTYSNDANLVIAVDENTPGYASMYWGSFTSGSNTGIAYRNDSALNNPDPQNPPPASMRTGTINRIQLVFTATVAPDAPQLVAPINGAQVYNGQALSWTLPAGSADATGYDVYIDGIKVSNNQPSTSYTLSGLDLGTHSWYVVARNAIGDSPDSDIETFEILDGGVVIGNGTANNNLPIHPYMGYNYSQTIYLQSDINVANKRIEQIAFYWNGAAVGTNNRGWTVYLAHTDKTAFTGTADWVPYAQLTQVFTGELDLPDTPGWVNILLQSPFVYNNVDNLLVAVDENTPGYGSSTTFFYSTAAPGTRALIYHSDGTNPDPATPPDASSTKNAFANMRILFGDLPTSPVLFHAPDAIDFDIGFANTPTAYQNVTVTNMGSGTLNLPVANISIIGTDAAMFELDPTISDFALTSGQSGNIPVRYSPTTAGTHTATLRMVYEGSNFDVALSGRALNENALYESFEAATFPPIGWNAGSWTYSTTSYHEARSAYKYGSTYTQYTLSTPMLTIDSDSRLNFWARCSNVSGVLQIVYSTDRVNWSPLPVGGDVTFAENNTWYNQDIDLSDLAGNNYYIGFRTGLNGYHSYYVDYVIGPDLAAIAPDAPTLTAPADNATDVAIRPVFTWTAANTGGVPTSYNIYCDANENPTTSIGTSTSTSFTPENALPYGSTLYWTVTAVNATGESDKATPRSFTTVADPTIYDLPWLEDFTDSTFPPTNWSRYTGLYPDESLTPTTSGWTRTAFANVTNPANYSARLNIWSTTTKYWLVTPPISIPASAHQLEFDLAITYWSNTAPLKPGEQQDDRFIVFIADNPGMVDATELRIWDNVNSPYVFDDISATGESHIIDLSAHSGVRYIAFYGESTASGGDNYLFVDNVLVRETPTDPIFAYTPTEINFGTVMYNTPSAPMNVTVSNTGAGVITLNASDISIIGANAADFSFGTANLPANLATGQSVDIPITVNGTTEGSVSATLRMVYNQENYDVALSADVLPQGTLFIGDGTSYNSNTDYPCVYGGWYKNGREQYILTAAELTAAGAQAGYLNSIGFNVHNPNTSANLPDFTISVGTTEFTEFPNNTFLDGLTEVFYFDKYTPVAGWNNHVFTTPFAWDGVSNLVIQTSYTLLPAAVKNASTYYTTNTVQQTLYYRHDSTAWDTVSTGTLSYKRPNMMLHVDSTPAPDIYAGEPYDAMNMNGEYLGAWFISTQDLYKVPGFDGTTGPVAELNLDPDNTHIAAYTAESGIFDLTFSTDYSGTYYLMGYWDGQWHQANFWPLILQPGEIGETVLFDIQFAAKGDVYIVFTRGFDPTVPVELSQFAATITAENYVQITWTTQSESNISGYNIYRNDSMDLSSAIKVSDLIEGTNTSEAHTYTYLDQELEQSGTYYYWLQNVELDGYTSFYGPVSVTFKVDDDGGAPDIPFVTKLENAYPNPFNPNTNIRYQLKDAGDVKIDIFNARGQLVRSFSRTHDAAGYYQINWDGRDSSGKAVSSGVYQYKMTSGKYHSTKKMVLKK